MELTKKHMAWAVGLMAYVMITFPIETYLEIFVTASAITLLVGFWRVWLMLVVTAMPYIIAAAGTYQLYVWVNNYF